MDSDELTVRLGAQLADPAVWVEPEPALQERIVGALTAARDGDELARRRGSRRIRLAVFAVAATVLAAVGITVAVTHDSSHPVRFAATLHGTPLAPAASGQVTLTQTASGWRIHLRATGLPRRDNGSYYEAWLKNSDGVLVPIGTFNQADDVTLWAGVAPNSFPSVTVTRQPADGNPSSTGQVVLVGTSRTGS